MKKNFLNLFFVGVLSFGAVYAVNGQDTPPAGTEANATTLYNEGLAALKEKNYKSGFTILESAYEKAKMENNEEVLGLSKKNLIFAAYNYGEELIKGKNAKEAIIVYQKGLAVDATSSLMHQGIGKAKEEMADAEGAAASYMTSLDAAKAEKDEKKVSAAQTRVKNLLVKQLQAKAFTKVIKIGTDYLAVDNANSDITYLVGKAYTDKGDNTNGIKYLLETVDLSNKAGVKVDDKVYYGLGVAYDAKKDAKNAIKYLGMVTDPKYKASADAIITKLKTAK